MNSTQNELAVKLGKILSAGEWSIATAESCTGGLMAARLTDRVDAVGGELVTIARAQLNVGHAWDHDRLE